MLATTALSANMKFRMVVLTLFLLTTQAYADQIIMNNGDIISGEVTKISDEKAYINPSYTDEFAVKIADVASIVSEKEFIVEMEDGSKITDAHLDIDTNGKQVLVVENGETPVSLAKLLEVSETPPDYERVSHADINMTVNSGNTDSKSSIIFFDTQFTLGDHRHLGSITTNRDETDGITTKKQDLLAYQYNWLFNDPWYTGITANYERDPIRELSHRYTIGAIFGRDLIKRSGQFLTFSFGLGYSDESIGPENNNGLTGLWSLNYEQELFSDKLKFYHNDTINYQFFGNNNVIFKTNTGFQFDLVADIYAKASFRYDYETEPAAGASNDDSTLAIGIGAKF